MTKKSTESEFERRNLKIEDLEAIVERTKVAALSSEDHETLKDATDMFVDMAHELQSKNASIKRLQHLIFGPSTEKTDQIVSKLSTDSTDGPDTKEGAAAEKKPKKKRKGHGRNGAAAYTGAKKVPIPIGNLKRGDPCPDCKKGRVYPKPKPGVLLRVTGMAPLQATLFELESLRCSLCGEVHTAQAPPGVGEEKYDETATSMVGMLRYGCGFPFHRLEKLQKNLGIPLPATTQWDLVDRASKPLTPAFEELIRQAAQGDVLHNDDTIMKILDLEAQMKQLKKENPKERTGVFTSGIVSTRDGNKIAMYFTGREHAGENLSKVLSQRASELSPPIQMCDALSRNTMDHVETILGNCNAHARRRFAEVFNSFPEKCKRVLDTLSEVYHNDAIAKKEEMSPEERLRFHQTESGPLMKELKGWLKEQDEENEVEPNSGLGKAIGYMRKHWEKLTLFLREPGAPLDNNAAERILKKAILHRRGSLFYKTENGARVGDIFMSLIHTAELNNVDPFDYLVALQRYHQEVSENPSEWMPWNYQEALARLSTRSPPEE